MKIVDLPLKSIQPAPWNPNAMDEDTAGKLKASIHKFGLVLPLVVRPLRGRKYETIGGAQRLGVLKELGYDSVPCVVVTEDDASARLLSQVLNRLHGEDDLGLKAELIRKVLESASQEDVMSLLPETADSLNTLLTLGKDDMASYLDAWQKAQVAKLKHFTFQLTSDQKSVVEEALERVAPGATKSRDNPNQRGQALYELCEQYLERNVGV